MTDRSTAVSTNRDLLDQGRALLEQLTDAEYASPRHGWSPVGAQYRHVLEHYQCFLAGLDRGFVDYDGRNRDEGIEQQRTVALDVTETVRRALESLLVIESDRDIEVQMQCSADVSLPERHRSSTGRELQFLVSHTVHHYALIKLLLERDGIDTAPGFGTAPSTLAHSRAAPSCAR